MARNGSGTFSVSATFSPSTPALSATVNSVLDDIGDELTNSVAKDGQTTMTGQLKASDGTVTAPGLTFGADLNTGWYRIASGKTGYAADGVLVATLDSTGFTLNSGAVLGTGIVGTTALADNAVTLAKVATQATGTVLANVTGGSAVPTAVTYSGLLDAALGTTQGTILYRSGSAWTTLAVGTSGQFLKTQGAAANPAWGDVLPTQTSNAGKVLTTNGTATSWADLGVTARFNVSGNMSSASPTLTGAVNVASVTRIGTGVYDVVFTTTMANANYSVLATAGNMIGYLRCSARSTSGFTLRAYAGSTATAADAEFDCVVHGGL